MQRRGVAGGSATFAADAAQKKRSRPGNEQIVPEIEATEAAVAPEAAIAEAASAREPPVAAQAAQVQRSQSMQPPWPRRARPPNVKGASAKGTKERPRGLPIC